MGSGTRLCSDILHQSGDVEPTTHSDELGRWQQVLVEYQQGPLANDMPYSTLTEPILHRLVVLQPKTLATMHGSAFVGGGARVLHDLVPMFKMFSGRNSARIGRHRQPFAPRPCRALRGEP